VKAPPSGQQAYDWEKQDRSDPAAIAWNSARKIAIIYALVAILWILTSDAVVHALADGFLSEQALQSFKGIAYVLVTSTLLWWLVYRHMKIVCESQARLALLLERMPLACVVEDNKFRVSAWNSAAEKIFGFSKSDVIGRTPEETFIPPSAKLQIDELRRQLLENETNARDEMPLIECRTRDGRSILCEWRNTLLLGRRGEYDGILGMAKDVTEHERIRNELSLHREHLEELVKIRTTDLETANRELQQLEKFRDNLIHMIVHDMRSPLQVILGNIDLIKLNSGNLDTRVLSLIKAVETSANKLLNSISELLDIRKLESGQMSLKRASVDLGMLTSQAMNDLKSLSTNHTILWNPPKKPTVVNCDAEIIQRVIVNMVGNALKYTPDGGIVSISITEKDNLAIWAVTDNGPGIPRDFHAKVFDLFAQIPVSPIRKHISTGLGLAFCKLAVEAHQGRVSLESEPGKGSTFQFELPL